MVNKIRLVSLIKELVTFKLLFISFYNKTYQMSVQIEEASL